MKYRMLGKTGFNISEVSLGSWQLGGKWGEKFNEKTAESILNKAIETGINFIDTADVYNNGQSEIAIGKFLKKISKRIYIATKSGRKLNPHTDRGYNEKNITTFINDSLKRLDVETIDLIQLHCPPTETYSRPEVFEILDKLKKKGKILNYGVSVEKVEEALKAMEYPGVSTIQIIYNMFRLKPAELFFKAASKSNVGIIVRVPLASGLLSGKYDKNTIFSKDDHRSFNREGKVFDKGETFSGIPYETGLQAVEELKKIFPYNDLPKYALRWILMDKSVSCVIPGASNVSQVEANSAASDLPGLTQDQMNKVKDMYEKYVMEYVQNLW
ncbi:MAG: aldo/keto reductase [Actinobacteria bacterium RBG_13_35_12]|nr:MAG: aldo/keto reductase [Actinobacteria bacterium RBG_13_35_12]